MYFPKKWNSFSAATKPWTGLLSSAFRTTKKGEVIKAFVVPKAQFKNTVTADGIISWAKQGISPYKVPKTIEFRDDLPMSGAGKVLRRVLLEEELKKSTP